LKNHTRSNKIRTSTR